MINTDGKFIYLIDLEKEFNDDIERLKISSLLNEKADIDNFTMLNDKLSELNNLSERKRKSKRSSSKRKSAKHTRKTIEMTNIKENNLSSDRKLLNDFSGLTMMKDQSKNKSLIENRKNDYERKFRENQGDNKK